MVTYKRRDLTVTDIGNGCSIIIGCDSCGGIGQKSGDSVTFPPYYVGRYTGRVAIMEVICSGATVIAVSNTVCNEMNDTGWQITDGLEDELTTAGIDIVSLTGSTEENFPTVMTAAGITVVGICETDKLIFRKANRGDIVVLAGKPKFGGELVESDKGITTYSQVYGLISNKMVKEISPAGSKGILHEVSCLADLNGLTFKPDCSLDCSIDIIKSCGPATCVVAVADNDFDFLKSGMVKIGLFV